MSFKTISSMNYDLIKIMSVQLRAWLVIFIVVWGLCILEPGIVFMCDVSQAAASLFSFVCIQANLGSGLGLTLQNYFSTACN